MVIDGLVLLAPPDGASQWSCDYCDGPLQGYRWPSWIAYYKHLLLAHRQAPCVHVWMSGSRYEKSPWVVEYGCVKCGTGFYAPDNWRPIC